MDFIVSLEYKFQKKKGNMCITEKSLLAEGRGLTIDDRTFNAVDDAPSSGESQCVGFLNSSLIKTAMITATVGIFFSVSALRSPHLSEEALFSARRIRASRLPAFLGRIISTLFKQALRQEGYTPKTAFFAVLKLFKSRAIAALKERYYIYNHHSFNPVS